MEHLTAKEKIQIIIEGVEACHLFDVLIKFLTYCERYEWDSYMIESDGSISYTDTKSFIDELGHEYSEEEEKFMTDDELEDFLVYAKKLAQD